MKAWHYGLILYFGLMGVVLFSNLYFKENAEEKREKEWKEEQNVELEAETQRINELERKYKAIYFPANQLEEDIFTYSLQKFFEKYTDRPIIIKGFLEDIEILEGKVVAEFSVPFGHPFLRREGIYFRLTASDGSAQKLLEGKRADPNFKSIRYLLSEGGNYMVVANVRNIQKIPTYRIDGTKNGEMVDLKGNVSRRLISTGQLLEATLIQKE